MDIIDCILAYEREHGAQAAGTVSASVLRKIIELSPSPLQHSAETGSGKTTVLLSHLSDHHLCFTFDDTVWYPVGDPSGSIHFVERCPLFQADKTEFVIGPTQRTLPTYKFDHVIDLALIDGAHGYPFPELDYYFLYPHLRLGSILIVDDIHIPTIRHLAEFLSEDEMFKQIHVEGTTAFFQRTASEIFDPEGDGWTKQRFNTNRCKPSDRRSVIRRGLRTVAQTLAPSLMDRYSRNRIAGRW